MYCYVGQTRSHKLIETIKDLYWGEMVVRGEYPPKRRPWAYDNGAYRDFKQGRPFDERTFLADIYAIHGCGDLPDFIILPDIVQGGLDSLSFSIDWAERLDGIGTLYLPVQDGMTPTDVKEAIYSLPPNAVSGLFLGGSDQWRIKTGVSWCSLAKELYLDFHIGRVGTAKKVAWAQRIGAHSIDSCLPLWSSNKLRIFKNAMADPQLELFHE